MDRGPTGSDGARAMHNPDLPWIEKYRPRTLGDVVGNNDTIDRLKVIAQQGNMPHLIISGLPGIGKTSSIICMAHQMLGDSYKEAVLELNASDERGIDVIRGRIKSFAQKKANVPTGMQKIIILDEADSMTAGAQQALRRTMEIYSNTTRFVLACNSSNKIIEPIQSRCAILRYARLSNEEILKRLLEICKAEIVKYSEDGLAALIFCAEGDMRQAINNLQSTVAGCGFVSGENVLKTADQPSPGIAKEILEHCQNGEISASLEKLNLLWSRGYSAIDIITTLFRVLKTTEMPEMQKLDFIKEIGITHSKLLEGIQSYLQLSALIARLTRLNMDENQFSL